MIYFKILYLIYHIMHRGFRGTAEAPKGDFGPVAQWLRGLMELFRRRLERCQRHQRRLDEFCTFRAEWGSLVPLDTLMSR